MRASDRVLAAVRARQQQQHKLHTCQGLYVWQGDTQRKLLTDVVAFLKEDEWIKNLPLAFEMWETVRPQYFKYFEYP